MSPFRHFACAENIVTVAESRSSRARMVTIIRQRPVNVRAIAMQQVPYLKHTKVWIEQKYGYGL
jgi:hypothetical protein